MPERSLTRRKLLQAAVGGAAFAAARGAFAQPRSGPVVPVSLRGNVVQLAGARSNAVALVQSERVALVDGAPSDLSGELVRLLADITDGRRVDTLFNTHWHWDHTGSNDVFGREGAAIVAHEETRLWLGADFHVEWEDRRYHPRAAEALPTDTFYTSRSMSIGEEEVELGHLPLAHTDGDVYVFFPEANVLAAGDTLFVGRYPILDYSTGGWIGGLIEANERLLELVDSDTLIVPGTGPVQDKTHLQRQRDMLSAVMERMVQMFAKALSAEEMLARGVTAGFDEAWGDPTLFVTTAYPGLWAHRARLSIRVI